jgi:hypothetical protein
MPLLYLALVYLHHARRWPLALLAALLLVQAGTIHYARSYRHVEFSPLARLVLDKFPSVYAPEPEIFLERSLRMDGAAGEHAAAAYPSPANPRRILVNPDDPRAHLALCGAGSRVLLDRAGAPWPGGWRYLDAPVVCAEGVPALGPRR